MDFTNRILTGACVEDNSLWFFFMDTVGTIAWATVIMREKIDKYSWLTIAVAYSDGSTWTGFVPASGTSGETVISQQDITLVHNTAITLTIPATAYYAKVQLTSGVIRWRLDAVAATVGTGFKATGWDSFALETRNELTSFRWLALCAGHITVTYYNKASTATE